MKVILVCMLLLAGMSAEAGTYAAVNVGRTKVLGEDPGVKDKIKGNSMGLTVGQRFSLIAGEVFYRSQTADGTVTFNGGTTPTTIDMKTKIMGGGVRLFVSFLSLFGGFATHDLETTATQSGTAISTFPLNGSFDGAYWGLGAKIGFVKFDFFADLTIYDLDTTAFQNVEFGLRYYF